MTVTDPQGREKLTSVTYQAIVPLDIEPDPGPQRDAGNGPHPPGGPIAGGVDLASLLDHLPVSAVGVAPALPAALDRDRGGDDTSGRRTRESPSRCHDLSSPSTRMEPHDGPAGAQSVETRTVRRRVALCPQPHLGRLSGSIRAPGGNGPAPAASEVAADSAGPVPPCRTALVSFEAVPLEQPLRLRNRRDLEPWDLSLQEAIFVALSHAEVIRQNGQFFSPTNTLLRSPRGSRPCMIRALQESGVLFGQRGVEAALSDFDTQFTTRTVWGNSQQIQNNPFIAGGLPGRRDPGRRRRSVPGVAGQDIRHRGTDRHQPQLELLRQQLPRSPSPLDVRRGPPREFRQPLLAGGGASSRGSRGPSRTTSRG